MLFPGGCWPGGKSDQTVMKKTLQASNSTTFYFFFFGDEELYEILECYCGHQGDVTPC